MKNKVIEIAENEKFGKNINETEAIYQKQATTLMSPARPS